MKAEIWEFGEWFKLDGLDYDSLKIYFENTLECAGFDIRGSINTKFHPIGFTALWLLAESHLAIHTFDEEGKFYMQITSCNHEFFEEFVRLLKEDQKRDLEQVH